ncbi:D-alanyl-D-alanine carboxypeptidase family protein [Amylibacter sp. IMCC11727]|uniref:D-alanyl-D-alanine carboxypeptidase family protein n=1 Tax=Amylibacter sp. IMCC11727 TaxID=3039851 RepID=UPI00244E2E61|nr:D-alanyl-D-alanine carboxypeptidase family protein [Amylibacter sp. IMCC11727]WGI20522.1 D-alanyl-D-alanine carboxypeptidase [Amylibacter sp. IMCC11727]
MRFAHLFTGFVIWLLAALPATAFDTIATSALVMDQTSGTVLLAKNEDRPVPPASMSKLMTLNMLFEALQDGRVNLDTKFTVSKNASEKGGSKMFVKQGDRISVENLIRGIIVHSGNDACIVVAENLAGSEADFARIMTARARKLGMNESTFANATGWPDPNHRMSARDLVSLANRLMTQFPEYYGYFQERSFTWSDITQSNRNPLLGLGIGADGLKTGHTSEAGYGLVGTARQGDRRVILMINGLQSSGERAPEAERLMNWAFRQFAQETLIKAGKNVAQAEVWLGETSTVALEVADDISALVPYSSRDSITMSVTYDGPIPAPIKKGTELGVLNIEIPDLPSQSYPVFAASDVESGGIMKRLRVSADKLMKALN